MAGRDVFLSVELDGDSINLASDEGDGDAADAQLSMLSELLPSPGNLSFTFPGEVPLLGGSKVYDANQFILGCHYTTAAANGNDIWATKSRYYYANEEVPGPSLEPEQPVEIAPSGDGLSRVAATAAALAGLGAAGIGIASAFASDPEKRQSASQ